MMIIFAEKEICLIEWAELIQKLLPEHVISSYIEKAPQKGFDYRKTSIDGKWDKIEETESV